MASHFTLIIKRMAYFTLYGTIENIFQFDLIFFQTYSCNPSDNNCLWKCDRGCPFSGCNADGYCDILSHIQIIEEFKVEDGDWS